MILKRFMPWNGGTITHSGHSVFFLQLYLTLVATAVFIIPAILIAICYIIIVVIIWKRSSSSFNKQYSDAIKEKSSKKPLQNKKGNIIMWFFFYFTWITQVTCCDGLASHVVRRERSVAR